MTNRSLFRDQVREALHHLYDAERLRSLPLSQWLRADGGVGPQAALSRLLIDAIEALKPSANVPPDTPDWRTYYILYYRFVQCMTVQEVTDQLAIGERHLRRHQRQAIEQLAEMLWRQQATYAADSATAPTITSTSRSSGTDVPADLAWLQLDRTFQQVNLADILAGVNDVIIRLARDCGVQFVINVPPDLPRISIHPLAMRQVLVGVFSSIIQHAPGATVKATAHRHEQLLVLRIQIDAPQGMTPPASAELAVVRQLLAMYNGVLELEQRSGRAHAILISIPLARRLPVLIVEDNVDTAELYSRYLNGSRYRPVVADSGQEAMQLLPTVKPRAIILDVMMPGQDGWETLILLRSHPLAENIPVVVTTILSERELALSLGAAEFLNKPVGGEQLLATLEAVVGREQRGARDANGV